MRATTISRPGDEGSVDYPRIALIGSAHMMNDLYGNVMTSLTPYLILRGFLSTSAAGTIVLVYLLGSSVLQPIFGLIADRSGRRIFAVAGPIWIGLAATLYGWVENPLALLLVAAVGGIGTAAFHPQGAAMVQQVGGSKRGWTMSLFSAGGNLGFSIGPLAAAIIASVGLHWSAVLLLPGIVLTMCLVLYAPRPEDGRRPFDGTALRKAVRRTWKSLAGIVCVIAIRSGVQFGFIFFLPLYYHALHHPAQQGSTLAFLLTLSGAAGGLIGGSLSDRVGRRVVVVGSLVLGTPLLYLAVIAPLPYAWLLIALAGGVLLSSNSVTVVQAQERLPASAGIASGLTLGLGFGLSGVIASLLTSISTHLGVSTTLQLVPLLSLLAAAIAVFVPDVSPAPWGGRSVLCHMARRP